MRVIRLIAFCFLLQSLPVWAKVPPIMAPLSEHEKAVADYPQEVIRWVEAYLPTIKPETHPREWIRALIMREHAFSMRYENPNTEETQKDLGQALALAQEKGYVEEEIVLLLLFVGSSEEDKSLVEQEKRTLRAIQKAEAVNDKRLWMRGLVDHARFLHALGNRETEAIKYFRQVQDMIKNDPNVDRIEAAMAKVKIGFMLDDSDMGGEKTVQTYESVLQEFRSLGLRQFQVTMIFNIALTLKEELEDKVKSRQYFEELLRICPQIEDWQNYAMALANLAEIEFPAGDVRGAEKHLLEAKKILQDKQLPYLEFMIDYFVPHYVDRKMWAEALKHLDEIVPMMPNLEHRKATAAAKLRHRILSKLGRFEEAYSILKKIHFEYTKSQEQKNKESFEKSKVELGLAVEEAKTKNLEMQNKLQSEQIKNVRRLQIASLVLLVFFMAVMSLMVVAIRRGKVIKQAKEKMQQILETIDEGLLTVSRNMTIIDEHSPFMQQLFPNQKLSGVSVMDGILKSSHLNVEELSMAQESLRVSLGEDVLNWEFNSGHLPQELHLKDGRWISLHWQPIVEQGRVEKVLLAIRDITMRHQLEETVAKQQKMMQGLQRKVNEILSSRTQDVRRLLEHLFQMNQELRDEVEHKKQREHWLRVIHTAKGEARGLGLKELSSHIHQLETALKSEQHEQIQTAFHEYSDTLNEYKYLIRDVFGLRENSTQKDTHLIDIMAPLTTALRQQLHKAGLSLGNLEIRDQVRDWPEATLNALRHSLVHVLANAADHGYIMPMQAGRKFSTDAWFGIEALESDQSIRVTIRDHGVGLDLEKLRRLAEVRSFEPAADETIADVVFLDGASTAVQVSETSGRGIGLSAVRALCRNTGGNAWFRSNDQGPGALLILEFQRPATIAAAS